MFPGSSHLDNYTDLSAIHPPHRALHPSICLPATTDYSQYIKFPAPSTVDRNQTATGTRKHITLDSLLSLDAPIQPRKYITPSATSRKDAFIHLQCRGPGGDEQDELVEDSTTLPTADLKQLEWKRHQNTLAARKSRQRKLKHQLELEETVTSLSVEKETWKARALMYEALLRSNGIRVPELS